MSIRKNVKRSRNPWECRWAEDGKHYSRSFPTRKEAEQFDADRRAALNGANGFRTRDEKITLNTYAEKFLAQKKKPSTALRNSEIYKLHIQPIFGTTPLRQIRHSDVQKIVDIWASKNLSSRTILRQLAVLSAILTLAFDDGVINRVPTKRIKRPAEIEPHRYAMTVEEIQKLRSAIHPNYQAFVYTLVETGMRIGEAINLNIEDFDEKKRTLKITGAKTKTGNRIVQISTTTQALITAHLRATKRVDSSPDSPLFVSHRNDSGIEKVVGTRINYSNFRTRIFKVAATSIGLPQLQPHDLRRTAATLMVLSKSSHKAIQAQLGHADIRTTLNLYAQATDEARVETVNRMEMVLNPQSDRGMEKQ